MFFTKHRQLIRWIIIVASFAIISLILWNTYVFFQKFKAEERRKMQTWSYAQSDFLNSFKNGLDGEVNNVTTFIITDSTSTTPMILVSPKGEISSFNNLDTLGIKNVDAFLRKRKLQFEKENNPIALSYFNNKTNSDEAIGTLYYGNSPLLNKLKYYPLALLLIIVLFGAVVYFFYRSSKIATQNKLWSGMAKETAHQIGTPLSSLIGWTEILKGENTNPEYIKEIEKDISRLQTITERFSKIGSLPTLEKVDIVAETKEAYDYLKTRSSRLINFDIKLPEHPIYVNLNTQLYGWTIENLVKNAIDAMKGKGDLQVSITQLEQRVKITVTDTGKGISKNEFNTIFEPGYTTKKRGWGLGLSLAKRIVEDFHNGRIKVLNSEKGKGTTMQISLKTI
ncbi:sensor histidine kinase [Olleya marilimosa]|uniref:sensor histidine kinase n=1 Tax=Olleya marilimosa TaxID=272164 RepID=UPI000C1610B7|nr:HAMP domain-containing sensor histidine kinase [Olleya marilimosa]MBD3891470.1 HAMP domain-containing histidine kinase [Olleya marilimosa]PIB33524.1 two-component sensor histidine kinase [Gaetbulibacter sp. 5U11]